MRKLFDYLFHSPSKLFLAILMRIGPIVPDKLYLRWLFRLRMGSKLHLKNPQTFSEKLQWLKLYDRKPEYTQMVDKYEAKKYVASIIGEEYIIPTLGVWDSFDEIDFDTLPDQFVLKTTHDSGGLVICRNKSNLDIEASRRKINKSLKHNYYLANSREWPYKNVKPRIIAEQYMVDKNGELNDYKFFCFSGVPKVMMIATERQSATGVCFDYFDMEFNHLPFEQGGPNSSKQLTKPTTMDAMVNIATQLSANIPHVRVDLYNVDEKIFFGELTFFDCSGMAEFTPREWNYTFGSWIDLDCVR